jgi:hypothetical protein
LNQLVAFFLFLNQTTVESKARPTVEPPSSIKKTPPPLPPAPVKGDLSQEEADLRLWTARVSGFYAVYCPSKAGEGCRDTAKKFKGREADLFEALYHKYSVDESEQTFHTVVPPGWRDAK